MPDTSPVLRAVDAVTVPVPDLDAGLDFYRDRLGQQLIWRNDELGQAGLRLPGGDSELVLSTRQPYEPNWLVTSVDDAADDVRFAGTNLAPYRGPIDVSAGTFGAQRPVLPACVPLDGSGTGGARRIGPLTVALFRAAYPLPSLQHRMIRADLSVPKPQSDPDRMISCSAADLSAVQPGVWIT